MEIYRLFFAHNDMKVSLKSYRFSSSGLRLNLWLQYHLEKIQFGIDL